MVGLGSLSRGGVGKRPSRHYGLRKGRRRVDTGPAPPGTGYFLISYMGVWHFKANYFK